MTEVAAPVFGAGKVAGETVMIFAQRVFRPALIVMVPLMLAGLPSTIDRIEAAANGYSAPAPSLLLIVLQALAYILATGFLTAATHEALCGRSIRIIELLADIAGRIFVLLICSTVVGVAVSVGFSLMILPGLWILAVWSVVAPVIVIEGAGFHAFARSAQLTQGYRWPIAGALFLIGLTAALPPLIFAMFFTAPRLIEAVGVPVFATATEIVSVLCLSMSLCGFTVIHARLRELKTATERADGPPH